MNKIKYAIVLTFLICGNALAANKTETNQVNYTTMPTYLGTNFAYGDSMDIITAITNGTYLKASVADGVTNWQTVPASDITNGLITASATVTNAARLGNLDSSLYVTNNGAATLGLTANANINGGGYYITNAFYPVYTTPYQIGFADTVTVAVDRIWQRYDPTNTTVLVMPAPISGQVGRVSIDINAGANSFTLSNVNLTGTGTNNGTMMFYSGSTGGAWKVQSF